MKIINKVENAYCRQWVKELTEQAIQNSNLDCTKVVIDEFDFDKRISLKINDKEYTIKILDFIPLDRDTTGRVCRAIYSYTLFMMVEEEDGSGHGEEIDHNTLMIAWKNKENSKV